MNQLTMSLILIIYMFLTSCTASTADLSRACEGVDPSNTNLPIDCSTLAEPTPTPTPVPTPPAPPIVPVLPSSFTISGTVTGSTFTGLKVVCSTVEAVPIEQTTVLTGTGVFSQTFNKSGSIPVRCLFGTVNNSTINDIIFTETVTQSFKGQSNLNSVVAYRKADSTTLNLGTISYNGTDATAPLSGITQDGTATITNSWTDLSGTWDGSTSITLDGFSNNMNVSVKRWNQIAANDGSGQPHTGLSSWRDDAGFTACGSKEGLSVPAGWTATLNNAAFDIFSDPTVNFATNLATTASYADVFYGATSQDDGSDPGQNICGVNVNGLLCSNVNFGTGGGGLSAAQCKLLCVIKSMDAILHFNHPSYQNCQFEYKTNLTGNFTNIPQTCVPSNGDPCPPVITKPEFVRERDFFEEAKMISDVASFHVSQINSVRSCVDSHDGSGSFFNTPDGDFDDANECGDCGFTEKRSVIVRRLTTNQAYVSERLSRIPLVTNNTVICASGFGAPPFPRRDDSFLHRIGFFGLNLPTLPSTELTSVFGSHTYLMTK